MNAHANLASTTPPETGFLHGLEIVGQFLGHIGWPVVALVALFLFRGPISRINKFTYKDFSIDVREELKLAAADVQSQSEQARSIGPTSNDVARSGRVAELASRADTDAVRRTVRELASEYESIRASMMSGSARTRRMEVVVAKMRALGRASLPIRSELMVSDSPGMRLAAIASLQVAPDYDALQWLVDRLAEEKPFVSYHAAVALTVAARDPLAAQHQPALEAAYQRVSQIEPTLPEDSDRRTTLRAFANAVELLRGEGAKAG